MSGHSKWSQIKRQKGAADAKRGILFSKLASLIALTSRDGSDPETNFKLRLAVEQAKRANLPTENIERAIKKGSGQLAGEKIEEVFYEAYGPAGIALLIVAATDNRNRTTAEIKNILARHHAKLAPRNNVLYLFEQIGELTIIYSLGQKISRDEIELLAIDNGATNIEERDNEIYIYSPIYDLQRLKQALEKEDLEINSARIIWAAKRLIQTEAETEAQIKKLIEALEAVDDVQEVFVNI